jgi:hypothetical protein
MTEAEMIEKIAEVLVDLSDRIKEQAYLLDFQNKLITTALQRIRKLESEGKGGELN